MYLPLYQCISWTVTRCSRLLGTTTAHRRQAEPKQFLGLTLPHMTEDGALLPAPAAHPRRDLFKVANNKRYCVLPCCKFSCRGWGLQEWSPQKGTGDLPVRKTTLSAETWDKDTSKAASHIWCVLGGMHWQGKHTWAPSGAG